MQPFSCAIVHFSGLQDQLLNLLGVANIKGVILVMELVLININVPF